MEENILLVVDDDKDVRETITDSLSFLENVSIITKENGLEALEYVKSNTVTALLSDISMPVMNGIELLTEVRNLGIDIPFIILSAYGDKKNTLIALRNGVFALLSKPFRIETLEKVVSLSLSLGKEMSQLEKDFLAKTVGKNLQPEEISKLLKAKKLVLFLKAKIELEKILK